MMTKALVLLADGFEELEAIAVADVMDRGGVEVTRASLGGADMLVAAHGTRVAADCNLDGAISRQGEFDAIVLPGGSQGTRNLMEDSRVGGLLRDFAGSGRLVAAICAAPMALGAVGLLSGRRFTCYPGCETAIKGGEYTDALPVVADGNILTSRGPGTAIDFGLAIVERLVSREAAQRVAQGMLYPQCRN